MGGFYIIYCIWSGLPSNRCLLGDEIHYTRQDTTLCWTRHSILQHKAWKYPIGVKSLDVNVEIFLYVSVYMLYVVCISLCIFICIPGCVFYCICWFVQQLPFMLTSLNKHMLTRHQYKHKTTFFFSSSSIKRSLVLSLLLSLCLCQTHTYAHTHAAVWNVQQKKRKRPTHEVSRRLALLLGIYCQPWTHTDTQPAVLLIVLEVALKKNVSISWVYSFYTQQHTHTNSLLPKFSLNVTRVCEIVKMHVHTHIIVYYIYNLLWALPSELKEPLLN